MVQGGARNRSGPPLDPKSARSDRRGVSLLSLPNGGYRGDVPPWPLGAADGGREVQIWAEAWRTPQACVWAAEAWRWPIIGEYCRVKAEVEREPAASAALIGQLHRYRDQIGLTPAGLKENGWAIQAPDILAAADPIAEESERPASSRGRLKVVGG